MSLLIALREFLANASLMTQVFLIALIVPLLYWLTPFQWRHRLLLGISVFTLLQGGVTVEYLALLALLISLTWAVLDRPVASESPPLTWQSVWIGLISIVLFGVTLGVVQRLPLGSVSSLLMGGAAVVSIGAIGTWLVLERSLWRGFKRRVIPMGILMAVCLPFAPNVTLTVTRFSPAKSLFVLLIAATVLCCTVCLVWAFRASQQQKRFMASGGIVLLIIAFVLFKLPIDGTLLSWYGFSYIAFRLLHVLLDRRQDTRLPVATFDEWSIYTLFFSAQAVGPIDRWPRFAGDIQATKAFSWDDFVTGWERILWGAIKKFFIADLVLRYLIPGQIPLSMISPLYAWLQLYAYAFYLYCDFSGFVDIAIGTARLLSFQLPENFDRPYTQGSLARFWQSWHMTLSSWLRTYVFLPLTRSLLRSRLRHFSLLTVLIANLVTMSLIGLWHGVTLNYLSWGLWHAFGLLVHKLFSDRTRRTQLKWKNTRRAQAFHGLSVVLTFHFVVMGWVFFALPTFQDSVTYLALLIGFRL